MILESAKKGFSVVTELLIQYRANVNVAAKVTWQGRRTMCGVGPLMNQVPCHILVYIPKD